MFEAERETSGRANYEFGESLQSRLPVNALWSAEMQLLSHRNTILTTSRRRSLTRSYKALARRYQNCQVYQALDGTDLNVAGGRISGVSVAGFTLGGGELSSGTTFKRRGLVPRCHWLIVAAAAAISRSHDLWNRGRLVLIRLPLTPTLNPLGAGPLLTAACIPLDSSSAVDHPWQLESVY